MKNKVHKQEFFWKIIGTCIFWNLRIILDSMVSEIEHKENNLGILLSMYLGIVEVFQILYF